LRSMATSASLKGPGSTLPLQAWNDIKFDT
jgi:hypothetical protein